MQVKKFKEYLEKQSLEINEIDLGDKEICDIKSNPVLLAEFYIKYFNEFRKIFALFDSAKELIEKHKVIFIEVLRLSSYKNSDCECNSQDENMLREFVTDKIHDGERYFLITEFFDFWLDVSFNKSESLSEVLTKLNKEDGEKK